MTHRAFNGSPLNKISLLSNIRAHYNAGHLTQGIGYQANNGCGCAVGCAIDNYDHAVYAETFQLDPMLPYLIEGVFEHLPRTLAPTFAVQALLSIPAGADTSQLVTRAMLVLIDELRAHTRIHAAHDKAMLSLRGLLKDLLEGTPISEDDVHAVYRKAQPTANDMLENTMSSQALAIASDLYHLALPAYTMAPEDRGLGYINSLRRACEFNLVEIVSLSDAVLEIFADAPVPQRTKQASPTATPAPAPARITSELEPA